MIRRISPAQSKPCKFQKRNSSTVCVFVSVCVSGAERYQSNSTKTCSDTLCILLLPHFVFHSVLHYVLHV